MSDDARGTHGPPRRPRKARRRQQSTAAGSGTGSRASPRRHALAALLGVLDAGESLDTSLARLPTDLHPRDRAFARELAYGVVRRHALLDALATRLFARPPRARDQDIRVVALLGLYQLLYTRVPAHAAVAETVALTRELGKEWAAALTNAVLRRFIRERDALVDSVNGDDAVRLSHPRWLIDAIRAEWPEQADAIFAANDQRAPMTLRVNLTRIDRPAYLRLLEEAGTAGEPVLHAPAAVSLVEPRDVASLPGFSEGLVSVQDAAAQLAAPLLEARTGDRVLDACAAPGGKTTHLLECTPDLGQVIAVDVDPIRLERVAENLARLGLGQRATLIAADMGSADLGSTDLGSTDLGSADLGSADLGSADLGSADLGSADLGSADLGSADLGSAGLGSAGLGSEPATVPEAGARTLELGPFDRILLDVPCTGTGVIRRHPDIRLLRRAQDATSLAARQRQLLASAWRRLTRGGRLLYATCSVLRAENDGVVEGFLASQSDAVGRMLDVPWGHATKAGRQILPGELRMDGFYFAVLEKT